MSNYDIYVRAITEMGAALSLPIQPMTPTQFIRAQIESDFVHQSVIDMDVFEAAFRG